MPNSYIDAIPNGGQKQKVYTALNKSKGACTLQSQIVEDDILALWPWRRKHRPLCRDQAT